MGNRFFFDLTNGRDILRDEQGVEATDLAEATEAARAVLEDTHDNGGNPAESWSLIIRDEEGTELETVCLSSGDFDESTMSAPPRAGDRGSRLEPEYPSRSDVCANTRH